MGAHSTLYVSRKAAMAYLLRSSFDLSDRDLEGALDRMLDRRLYNVRIVSDDEARDDEVLS